MRDPFCHFVLLSMEATQEIKTLAGTRQKIKQKRIPAAKNSSSESRGTYPKDRKCPHILVPDTEQIVLALRWSSSKIKNSAGHLPGPCVQSDTFRYDIHHRSEIENSRGLLVATTVKRRMAVSVFSSFINY